MLKALKALLFRSTSAFWMTVFSLPSRSSIVRSDINGVTLSSQSSVAL